MSLFSISNNDFKRHFPTRMLAVQILYAKDMNNHLIDRIVSDLITYHNDKYSLNNINETILKELTAFIDQRILHIDNSISNYLDKNWSICRLPKVVLAILRTSCGECILGYEDNIAILINDYLQITKSLNHNKEVKFINSVIHKVAVNTQT